MMRKDRSIRLASAAAVIAFLVGGHFAFSANADKALTAFEQVRENCNTEKELGWFQRLMKGDYNSGGGDGVFKLNDAVECEAVVQEIDQMEKQLASQRSELQAFQKSVAVSSKDKIKLNKQVAVLKGRYDESLSAIDLKDLEIKGLNEASAQLQIDLAKAEEQHSAAAEKVKMLSDKNSELVVQLAGLRKKLASDFSELKELELQEENAETGENSGLKKLKDIRSELEETKKKLKETETALAEIKQQLAAQNEVEKALKAANFDNLEVAELTDAATKLQVELSKAEEKLDAESKLVALLKEQKAASLLKIGELNSRLQSSEKSIEALTGTLNSADSKLKIEELQRELDQAKVKFSGAEDELRILKLELEATRNLLAKSNMEASDKPTAASNPDEDFEGELAELQSLNKELGQQLQSLQSTISGLDSGDEKTSDELKGLVDEIEQDVESVKSNEGRLVLDNGILFYPASASVSKKGRKTIRAVAEKIKSKLSEDSEWNLFVEGHTDRLSISTNRYPSNWHLGGARAANVVRILIKEGVPAERLSAVSMAALRPIDPGRNPAAYAKNRRVELRFIQF